MVGIEQTISENLAHSDTYDLVSSFEHLKFFKQKYPKTLKLQKYTPPLFK